MIPFFANVISGWTPSSTQNTEALFKAQDLQIGEISSTTFPMTHKMGLLSASISTTATIVDNVITYDGNSWNGTTWTSSSKTTLSYYASRTFTSTNKPYIASNVLYYIGRPSDNSITLATSASETGTLYYAWTLNNNTTSNTIVGSAGSYKSMTIPAYSGKTFRQKIWNFGYSGSVKTWKAPQAGSYKLECWGAEGGEHFTDDDADRHVYSGKGGYTYGTVTLSSGLTLYICAGQDGSDDRTNESRFNGGGKAPNGASPGGGATHIAKVTGELKDIGLTSAKSNVYVVAGGGGGYDTSGGNIPWCGHGGGASGTDGYIPAYPDITYGTGGTQTGPGANQNDNTGSRGNAPAFGLGGSANSSTNDFGGGGGGGWYGGGAGAGAGPGGGGSGYLNTSLSVVGATIVGNTSFTAPDGTTETGHLGAGYARITFTN